MNHEWSNQFIKCKLNIVILSSICPEIKLMSMFSAVFWTTLTFKSVIFSDTDPVITRGECVVFKTD